jgi:hypothetical protein
VGLTDLAVVRSFRDQQKWEEMCILDTCTGTEAMKLRFVTNIRVICGCG